MKDAEFIRFRSTCGKFGVSFQRVLFSKMLQECWNAGHYETGGILFGKYNDDLDDANILGFSTAPNDSKRGRFSFQRGIAGLQKMLHSLWQKTDREYYLGEWHFHPYSSPVASSTDRQQMFAHANDRKLHCPEPIMIIIGGNPCHDWNVNIAVYTREGEVHTLMPQDSNWQADYRKNPRNTSFQISNHGEMIVT